MLSDECKVPPTSSYFARPLCVCCVCQVCTTQPPSVPSPPFVFSVTDVRASSVTIDWTPPASDGGAAITAYIVSVGPYQAGTATGWYGMKWGG
jgi:hypothetical protein